MLSVSAGFTVRGTSGMFEMLHFPTKTVKIKKSLLWEFTMFSYQNKVKTKTKKV